MERVIHFFREISKIPRGSGNTDEISKYCDEFAKKRGLKSVRDEFNNVIIIKHASSECSNAKPVMLQAHLDMVCEKANWKTFNFESDAIEIKEKDGWIFADGTTLGADDGIGIAMILAVLDSDTIVHPKIEAVFTSDEETGMDGAINIDLSSLESKRLINLDSETADTITVSCAGGCIVKCRIPLKRASGSGKYYKIGVCGLLGGHSGVDIDKNRANALALTGRIIHSVDNAVLCGICGGDKHNVIPSSAEAVIRCAFDPSETVNSVFSAIKKEYETSDPDICVDCAEINGNFENFETDISEFIMAVPNGVFSFSPDIPGLVRTSLNIASVKIEHDTAEFEFFIRSSCESEKEYLKNKLSVITHRFGGEFFSGGDYPAWEYNRESEMIKILTGVFEEMFCSKPKIEAIHAGLECGIFCGKIKNLDCVSICPDILDIHTPDERMELKSLEKSWNYLMGILKKLGESNDE